MLNTRRVKRQFKSEDECTGVFDTGGGGMLAVQFEKECVTKPCLRKFSTDSLPAHSSRRLSLFSISRFAEVVEPANDRYSTVEITCNTYPRAIFSTPSFETLICLQEIEKKKKKK